MPPVNHPRAVAHDTMDIIIGQSVEAMLDGSEYVLMRAVGHFIPIAILRRRS